MRPRKSEERINKVSETYRGIRNTLRYQLSNLYDFDPAKHSVPDDKLTGFDRWILAEFSKLESEVIAAYDAYEFHVVYQKVSQFIAVELSSIYHDVVKDRPYTDAANSHRRRSTQTALHRLVSGLCKMLSPLLAFTADEAWEFVPGKQSDSIHNSIWQPERFFQTDDEQFVWMILFKIRDSALVELEKARQSKTVGKSLDAILHYAAMDVGWKVATSENEALRELCNVSGITVEDNRISSYAVVAASSQGRQKCERCWHWETDINPNHPEHPTICGRCIAAVKENLAAKV